MIKKYYYLRIFKDKITKNVSIYFTNEKEMIEYIAWCRTFEISEDNYLYLLGNGKSDNTFSSLFSDTDILISIGLPELAI